MNKTRKKIIAIHLAKTGGSSLKKQISSLFRKNEVYFDYEDDPADPRSISHIDHDFYINNKVESTENYKFIYGHFPSWKYAYIENAFRMTFLRRPVDNIFSIYNFWMSHDKDFWSSPLFRHTRENNLTVLQFSALPIIRYLYSKTYFQESDLERFDFIGKFENYDTELDRLGSLIGTKFHKDIRINTTAKIASRYGHTIIKPEDISSIELRKIKDLLADDIKVYERFSGR